MRKKIEHVVHFVEYVDKANFEKTKKKSQKYLLKTQRGKTNLIITFDADLMLQHNPEHNGTMQKRASRRNFDEITAT